MYEITKLDQEQVEGGWGAGVSVTVTAPGGTSVSVSGSAAGGNGTATAGNTSATSTASVQGSVQTGSGTSSAMQGGFAPTTSTTTTSSVSTIGVCTPASMHTDAPVSNDSGGGGGGGKVICTELCRNGVIEHDVWMADLDYSRKHFSEQTMRGYHLWGVPYVKLMRKSPLFAKLAQYPTQAFAQDIAYRMGVRTKPNYMGWALRELAFRPVCWSIGVFAKARDFQHLWSGKVAMA